MIKINNLTFMYTKNKRVLDDFSFHIPKGETKALLGHNGAGKTTVLRLILGFLKPNEGNIQINKVDASSGKLPRGFISYVPELIGVYEKLTGFQNLEFRARAAKINSRLIESNSKILLDKFRLLKRADEKVGYWSKGMKQRLSLACGLISDPKILLLDEPTSGLDPESRELFKLILKERQHDDIVTIICSHDLDFVFGLCDSITILQEGREVKSGKMPDSVDLLNTLYLKYTAGYKLG